MIAYVRGGQIWTIGSDGKAPQQLTHTSRPAGNPSWSQLGTQLAYDVGGSAIFVANADGSGAIDVSTESLRGTPGFGLGPCDRHPTWSPDGTQIAFTSVVDDCTGAAGGLYATSPTGHGRRTIEQQYEGLLGGDTQPTWQPGGDRIAFTRSDSLRMASGPYVYDIYLVNARTGRSLVRLTKTVHATSPAWSPDGKELAFVDRGEIEIMSASGRRERTIGPGKAPSWSPDGLQLAFVDSVGLERVGVRGGAKSLVLRCACAAPTWRPVP